MMSASLVYVMGPSGSGKDSLLRQAREALVACPEGLASLCFAHRYITRSARADAENHIALSPAEFEARCRAGLFALHWRSHGLDYGIGLEVEQWLARGMTVVVNGSRAHLATARERFPQLKPVLVTVSLETQRQRLLARGREGAAAVEARLARSAALGFVPEDGTALISNEGALPEATQRLLQMLGQFQSEASGHGAAQRPGTGAAALRCINTAPPRLRR